MKIKLLTAGLFVFGGLMAYAKWSPTTQNLSEDTAIMELALEKHFNCNIDSSHYQQIVWSQKLVFRIASDSNSTVSEQDARSFLTSNFPSFKYIDDFKLDY